MAELRAVRAEAQMIVRVADILQRTGIQSKEEFGGTLGVFATVTAEAAPEVGDILAYWASAVKDDLKRAGMEKV